MKQLEITTNKRLLIVEYDTEAELAIDFALMYAFNNPKVIKFGLTLKPICKGSELTEKILRTLIKNEISEFLVSWNWDYVSKEPLNDDFFPPMQSFISSIEASGYHWGENPEGDQPHNTGLINSYPTGHLLMDKSLEEAKKWQEAESRTFNPSKCIICEIV